MTISVLGKIPCPGQYATQVRISSPSELETEMAFQECFVYGSLVEAKW